MSETHDRASDNIDEYYDETPRVPDTSSDDGLSNSDKCGSINTEDIVLKPNDTNQLEQKANRKGLEGHDSEKEIDMASELEQKLQSNANLDEMLQDEEEFESVAEYSSENENDSEPLPPFNDDSEATILDTDPVPISIESKQHCGVLSKRRDVFKNQWRDRFFILDADRGELSYYLLRKDWHKRDRDNNNNRDSFDNNHRKNINANKNLEPRGTIYLEGGSVRILDDNEFLNARQRQRQNHQKRKFTRFGFMIASNVRETNSEIVNTNITYLAASSEQERSVWVEKIAMVCSSIPVKHTVMLNDNKTINAHDVDSIHNEWKNTEGKPLDLEMNGNMLLTPLHNVPNSLSQKIKEVLNSSLEILHDENVSNVGSSLDGFENQSWEPFFRKDGAVALKKTHHNTFMIKTEKLLNYDAEQIFHLISNIDRKSEYETNVQIAKRLHLYNPHTFLDYYSSSFIDSAQSIDYCVLSHWQVLFNEQPSQAQQDCQIDLKQSMSGAQCSNAIVFLSFSHDSPKCPENATQFVGENLAFSVWLLEPQVIPSSPEKTRNCCLCRVRYVASIDFNEDLPAAFVDTVTRHHALLPNAIEKCLDLYEASHSTRSNHNSDLSRSIKENSYVSLNQTLEKEIAQQNKNIMNSFYDCNKGNVNNLNTSIQVSSNSISRSKFYSETHKQTIAFENSKNSDEINLLTTQEKKRETDNENDSSIPESTKNEPTKNMHQKEKDDSTEMSNNEMILQEKPPASSPAIAAISLLSCSVLWLYAHIFPVLYPYRGLLFLLPFVVSIMIPNSSRSLNVNFIAFSDGMMNTNISQRQHSDKNTSTIEKNISSLTFSDITPMFPSVCWYLSSNMFPAHKEVVFLLTLYFTTRLWIKKKLGTPVCYSDGSAVGSDNRRGHTGLGTGELTSRFAVDLKGVLRFIGNKKEENREAAILNNDHTSVTNHAEIAVSHIVVKAIACAMFEMSVFNTRLATIPVFGIQGCFQRKNINISVVTGIHRFSKGANHALLLENVDQLSVRAIANQLAMKAAGSSFHLGRNEKSKLSLVDAILKKIVEVTYFLLSFVISQANMDIIKSKEQFGSCVVLTSPNSEHSDVDIEVSPSLLLGVNMVVVVGGVRVMRDTRGGSIRPALSMSITINCPAANVASCRRFSERVQQLVQFPEICDQDMS